MSVNVVYPCKETLFGSSLCIHPARVIGWRAARFEFAIDWLINSASMKTSDWLQEKMAAGRCVNNDSLWEKALKSACDLVSINSFYDKQLEALQKFFQKRDMFIGFGLFSSTLLLLQRIALDSSNCTFSPSIS